MIHINWCLHTCMEFVPLCLRTHFWKEKREMKEKREKSFEERGKKR